MCSFMCSNDLSVPPPFPTHAISLRLWSIVVLQLLSLLSSPCAVNSGFVLAGGSDSAEGGVVDGLWLHELYTATNSRVGWNSSCSKGWNMTAGANPCSGGDSWAGVLCNSSSRRVESVKLGGCNLCGKLPERSTTGGAMSHLVNLFLNNNSLTGALPSSWGEGLRSIESIFVNDNALHGSIPVTFSSLVRLKWMAFYRNNINGTLPPSLSSLGQLYMMDVSDNYITGSIPECFGNFPSMLWMRLNSNMLSGTLPPSLANLTSLQRLDVSENLLCGTLPDAFGNLTKLQTLTLNTNRFTGTIPKSWAQLGAVVNISLRANFIDGNLPLNWQDEGTMKHLSKLDIMFNCMNKSFLSSLSPAQYVWWLSKTENGARLMFQRRTCNCRNGQITTLEGYWCVDCPAGYYCPNTSSSVPCPPGTFNTNTAQSNATVGCAACPIGTTTASGGQTSASSCNISTAGTGTWDTALAMPAVLSESGATAVALAASAAALVAAAELTVLDLTTFAAIQSVRCRDVLLYQSRDPSSTSSSSAFSSQLKYVLSPFADLGDSVSSLGNVGLVAVIGGLHRAALWMTTRASTDETRHSRQLSAMSKLLYPAVSITVASVLLPGSVRGAILGAFTTENAPSTPVTALACVATAAAAGGLALVWRQAIVCWCQQAVYLHKAMAWVRRARDAVPCRAPFVNRVLLPRGRWTPSALQQRVGVVFASVAGPRQRWVPGGLLLLSVVTVAVSAAPVESDDTAGCSGLYALLAVLAACPAAVVVLRRAPYRVGAVNGFVVLNSVLTALTAAITAGALQRPPEAADGAVRVIDVLAMVVYMSSTARSVLLMALRVAARVFAPDSTILTTANVDNRSADSSAVGRRRRPVKPKTEILQTPLCLSHDITEVVWGSGADSLAALISLACQAATRRV